MEPVFRSQLVEINVGDSIPNFGQNIGFGKYTRLNGAYITSIEALGNGLLFSPLNKPVIQNVSGLALTLYSVNDASENITLYPCQLLDTIINGGIIKKFKPFLCDFDKSFVKVLSNTGIIATNSICFNVGFVYEKDLKRLK